MSGEGVRLPVRVTPRARGGRGGMVGVRDGTLLVKVAAAPVDGQANRAVCRLIAAELGIPRSAVTVARGEHSREKLLAVDCVEQTTIDALLARVA